MKKSAIKQAITQLHVDQLIALFPGGDPEYFESCLEHYVENPVERITEKIVVDLKGQYPQLPAYSHTTDNRLNACLRILALDLFPNCDIGYLRELVLSFRYAHIEQAVDTLLLQGKCPERLDYGKMKPSEGIRSERYKKQAQTQLSLDFPQVWRSSIRAVLAENNWDYIQSFDQLKDMGSGGFWNTLRNFFMHWSTSAIHEGGNITDRDLRKQLKELAQRSIDQQVVNDKLLADKINLLEYTEQDQLITCDCCYGDYAFEQLSFCSEGSHAFCHTCLIHYVSEGLFGQGALRGQPYIHCISSTDDCTGGFLTTVLQKVLPADIWMAYENSLIDDSVDPFHRIQCCLCPYFELDESTKPLQVVYASKVIRFIGKWIMVVEIILGVIYMTYNNWIFLLCLLLISTQWISLSQWDLKSDLEVAYKRLSKHRRGAMFQCRNDECKTLTCLECQRPARGEHTCWEKETDGLRLYVEKAMADAVKRTCPNCSLSFQKSDGCNKVVCRCGYSMCYVCRKDIGKESYAHFCDHFRDRPGKNCTLCKKCDLYKTEPDDIAVQTAANKAKTQYLKAHPEVTHNSNIVIGPKNPFEKMDELRKDTIIRCLEFGLQYVV